MDFTSLPIFETFSLIYSKLSIFTFISTSIFIPFRNYTIYTYIFIYKDNQFFIIFYNFTRFINF